MTGIWIPGSSAIKLAMVINDAREDDPHPSVMNVEINVIETSCLKGGYPSARFDRLRSARCL
jgi:hypothetical protein